MNREDAQFYHIRDRAYDVVELYVDRKVEQQLKEAVNRHFNRSMILAKHISTARLGVKYPVENAVAGILVHFPYMERDGSPT